MNREELFQEVEKIKERLASIEKRKQEE